MTSKAGGRHIESRTTYEAVLRCFHHQLSLSQMDHARVTQDLERAAAREPRSALVWALLAQCTLDKTVFGYSEDPGALAQGVRYARHALSLDSSCQYAHYANCYASLVERDAATVEYSAERILELNPNVPFMVGSAGFFLCLAGCYDRGMALFEKSVDLNPLFPSWLHAGPFFYHLKKGDLERALLHARQFALPDFFWGEIMRATALNLIGYAVEADASARRLRELKPDFPQKAREYVRFFLLDDELANRVLESLGSLEPLTYID
jgi:Tfp pilus assembly protein PilF